MQVSGPGAEIYSAIHRLLPKVCTSGGGVAHNLSPYCAQALVESAGFRSYRGVFVPFAARGDSPLRCGGGCQTRVVCWSQSASRVGTEGGHS